MTTPSERQCPLHRHPSPKISPPRAPTAWPPGPARGVTGWRLLIAMSRDLPGALAKWQKAHGDIVHLRIWPEHDVVVADPQLARELLVTHHDALIRWERAISVFSQVHGRSVLTAEGESWRTRRHALAPNFSPKAVQGFSSTIIAVSAETLAQWPRAAEHWPIERALTMLTMDAILRMTFSSGVEEDLQVVEQAIRVTSAAANAEFFWPFSMPDWMPWKREKRRARKTLNDMIERHLQRRLKLARDAWPDDLLTRFLLSREEAPALSLDDVRDECMTLFLAGHETTAATLVWWAWCMASNPEAQRVAREEVRRVLQGDVPVIETLPKLGYLTQTIKETMRRYPVAPLLISRRSRHAI